MDYDDSDQDYNENARRQSMLMKKGTCGACNSRQKELDAAQKEYEDMLVETK